MSFLLPVTDHAGEKACYTLPDDITPTLLAHLGISEASAMPRYALWGGGEYCTDLLLSAISDEATNRSLNQFSFRSPFEPHCRTALWVEEIGLIGAVDRTLPSGCRLIDSTSLSLSPSADEQEELYRLRKDASALAEQCQCIGEAFAKLEQSTLTMTAELHDIEKLARKTKSISAAQPIGSGHTLRLPIAALSADRAYHRLLPFGEEVQIIGLRELYGAAAHFITLLDSALIERSVDFVELTDGQTGTIAGIWLPSSKLCYLLDPPERRQKMITLSRFLSARSQSIRVRYRSLEGCKREILNEIAYLIGKTVEIQSQISLIEENCLQKSRIGEFRKRLLIDLFCR